MDRRTVVAGNLQGERSLFLDLLAVPGAQSSEVSDEEITGFNIPTGIPMAYELDDDLKPLSREFLGDPDVVAKAAAAVAAQGKAK